MALFPVGTVEITPGATAALTAAGAEPAQFLARHQAGDWGEDPDDSAACAFAFQNGHQITSNYTLPNGTSLFISTAADRSSTRMFLDDEYESREVGVREGYALWAESYDNEKNPLIAIEAPHVDTLLKTLPKTRVLDVGTGTGRHALQLARHGAHVTAIDQSPEMLALAEQAAQREGLQLELRLGAIEAGLPFSSNQFDLLTCALMLCHVPDLGQAVRECFRVLQPGGYLLITDFHPAVLDLGWRSSCFRPGTSYMLPNNMATRADYLHAVSEAGFITRTVLDLPIRDVPEGFLSDRVRERHGDTPLCLIVLAHKPAAADTASPKPATLDS